MVSINKDFPTSQFFQLNPLFFKLLCFPHPLFYSHRRDKPNSSRLILSSGFGAELQKRMGLSSFPTPSGGILPLLVVNTVLSVALVKSMVRSLIQLVFVASPIGREEGSSVGRMDRKRRRRVSITRFGSSRSCCGNNGGRAECCVCLCGFVDGEEVSELSCKHFFHRGCLQKWFDGRHATCPLCRSVGFEEI